MLKLSHLHLIFLRWQYCPIHVQIQHNPYPKKFFCKNGKTDLKIPVELQGILNTHELKYEHTSLFQTVQIYSNQDWF